MKKILLIALIVIAYFNSFSQDTKKNRQQNLQAAINNKRYVFNAQSASPLTGTTRQLTSDYNVRITADSIISYLPYFGRAYAAPTPSEEGGIKFSSTNFEYSVTESKKGGWEISIKPKDVSDTREFALSISTSGYGTLQVISNNRQPISYYGYVEAIK